MLDDGTVDGREKIVHAAVRSGLPVRHIMLPGVSKAAAWNIATRESSGEFLAFLDDDCVPPSGWLSAYEAAFDDWRAGVVGGPDKAPGDATLFEKCVDYTLTSFVGTLGLRRGSGRAGQYYPRPWNMAARREAVLLSGGFDESHPESPEVPMIHRMGKIGYRASYEPNAMVWHRRETDLLRFLWRDFRLSMERGAGILPPRLGKTYGVTALGLLAIMLLSINAGSRPFGLRVLTGALITYALVLAVSGIHALISTRAVATLVMVPLMLPMHHLAHLIGFSSGRLFSRHRVR